MGFPGAKHYLKCPSGYNSTQIYPLGKEKDWLWKQVNERKTSNLVIKTHVNRTNQYFVHQN